MPRRSWRRGSTGVELAVVVGGGQFPARDGAHRPRHGTFHRGSDRNAGHRHERARPAGPPGGDGRAHPGSLRGEDGAGGRAVHPPARHASPGEGAHRHSRRRDRQPLFQHRHGGGPARGRDRLRGAAQGDEGGRCLHVRPGAGRVGEAPAAAHPRRGDRAESAGDGPDGHHLGEGEPAADRGVQSCAPPATWRGFCAGSRWGAWWRRIRSHEPRDRPTCGRPDEEEPRVAEGGTAHDSDRQGHAGPAGSGPGRRLRLGRCR